MALPIARGPWVQRLLEVGKDTSIVRDSIVKASTLYKCVSARCSLQSAPHFCSAGADMSIAMQLQQDNVTLAAYCFGSWTCSSPAWCDVAVNAALMAACLHWARAVAFEARCSSQRALLVCALQFGRTAHLAMTHSLMASALALQFDLLVNCGEYGSAMRVGRALAESASDRGLPTVWPTTGLQLALSMKCAMAAEQLRECLHLGEHAKAVLEVTHEGTDVLEMVREHVKHCSMLLLGAVERA
jgi:hypothetical protein